MSFRASSVRRSFRSRPLLLVPLTILPWFLGNGQTTSPSDSLRQILSVARQYSLEKNYSGAVERYELYLTRSPKDDDVRNELARTYSWNSQYDSALAQYDIVIRNNRNNFDAHFGKCQVLAWKQDFQDAANELETLAILAPQNMDVLLLAGKIYAWNKDIDRSLQMYQKALSIDGSNEEAVVGECTALGALGKRHEAFSKIADARKRFPRSTAVARLYSDLMPRPANQVYAGFQQETFDAQELSDHNTLTLQYYRTMRSDLTLYAEYDHYRRFDKTDQSLGIGTYWTIADRQSLYAYCLVSPNPQVTSSVDCAVELTHRITEPISAFLEYRYLGFKTETAHILSPGASVDIVPGVTIRPRIYVSRTIVSKATSIAYALQMSSEVLDILRPFFYYAVGSEAYRGVTVDNVESSRSWSIDIGGSYFVSRELTLTVGYQYLRRIGVFQSYAFTVGAGYYW